MGEADACIVRPARVEPEENRQPGQHDSAT
jgi:hypothetical protein